MEPCKKVHEKSEGNVDGPKVELGGNPHQIQIKHVDDISTNKNIQSSKKSSHPTKNVCGIDSHKEVNRISTTKFPRNYRNWEMSAFGALLLPSLLSCAWPSLVRQVGSRSKSSQSQLKMFSEFILTYFLA